MNTDLSRRIGQNPAVNAMREANGTGPRPLPVRCPSCLKRSRPDRRSQRFCSTRCRQMAYWLAQIQKALHDGLAEGIRSRLEELGRRSS